MIAELRRQRLAWAVKLLEEGIGETLIYYAFPDSHWRKIRTNNPLERIMKEIRRRIGVVGAFPDGQPCLNPGSGLIDQSQKMTVAAIAMADLKAWAQRS